MKSATHYLAFSVLSLFLSFTQGTAATKEPVALVIHGGFARPTSALSVEAQKKMRDDFEQALLVGFTVIRKNGTALDAVQAAVKVLEDSRYFNAGKGADGKGTVGAVAVDSKGNLASATSGSTGIYADNRSAAIASTGRSENFLRANVASTIDAKISIEKKSLETAVSEVIKSSPKTHEGDGAVIAINAKGEVAIATNTPGLMVGTITRTGKSEFFTR